MDWFPIVINNILLRHNPRIVIFYNRMECTTNSFVVIVVIGIINTFQGIAEQNSVDLAVISPGIAEALVATAAGLFTAIPATIAYNLFRSMIRDLTESLDFFALQIIRRIQLQLIADEKKRL